MDQLKIGDEVLAADGRYSKVCSFSHKQVSAKAAYLQILTEEMVKDIHLKSPRSICSIFLTRPPSQIHWFLRKTLKWETCW